jgi:high-affinity iron transporter
MLGTFIVIFREAFEIALILGVMLAATKGIKGRNRWTLIGACAGVAGAVLIALFAEKITSLAEGNGQEIMNGCIMLMAAAMIGWTVVWMKTHGRELSRKMKAVGQSIREGETPLYTLAIIIALAIFREGSEIVLFSYGLLAGGTSIASFIGGALLGALCGAGVGALIYFGLLKIFARHFFSVTSWLLTLISAGMTLQAVGMFAQAGYLPEWANRKLWDSSGLLSEGSWAGKTMQVLVGYSSHPSVLQLIAYLTTVAVIVAAMKLTSHSQPPRSAANTAA